MQVVSAGLRIISVVLLVAIENPTWLKKKLEPFLRMPHSIVPRDFWNELWNFLTAQNKLGENSNFFNYLFVEKQKSRKFLGQPCVESSSLAKFSRKMLPKVNLLLNPSMLSKAHFHRIYLLTHLTQHK